MVEIPHETSAIPAEDPKLKAITEFFANNKERIASFDLNDLDTDDPTTYGHIQARTIQRIFDLYRNTSENGQVWVMVKLIEAIGQNNTEKYFINGTEGYSFREMGLPKGLGQIREIAEATPENLTPEELLRQDKICFISSVTGDIDNGVMRGIMMNEEYEPSELIPAIIINGTKYFGETIGGNREYGYSFRFREPRQSKELETGIRRIEIYATSAGRIAEL
ncbi:hypothetical protein KKF04_04425 [Patescibacteria group bacterium]|nr:hypothetical protein [Patescibacteria group bacterium]MBU1935275.1 hypothetical protein [Patescibacteria group bacterium]